MERLLLFFCLTLGYALTASAQGRRIRWIPPEDQPLGKTETEKRLLAELDSILRSHEVYANVPPADGRMLRLLAEATGAKNVVEIGTSTGYSGIWWSLALFKTGGRLTTFELDPARAAMAREHFKKAGVERIITIVEGDAHQNVTRLKDPIDILFLDADKPGYVDYLNKLLPLVRPGGLILAHNVEMTADYVKAVTTNPDLETLFYLEGNGLAITLKKR
jgi:predicted O-methyltransferase YrrM